MNFRSNLGPGVRRAFLPFLLAAWTVGVGWGCSGAESTNPGDLGDASADGNGTGPDGSSTSNDGGSRADGTTSTDATTGNDATTGSDARADGGSDTGSTSPDATPGSDGGADAQAANVTVGGRVSGLLGTGLTLSNSGADTASVAQDGAFTFGTAIAPGTTYAVTVASQPTNPSQTCSVTSGSGTATANVTDVVVTCVTNTYFVGGTVSGLDLSDAGTADGGSGALRLAVTGGQTVEVAANGTFRFAQKIASGTSYTVTVAAQPTNPPHVCTLAGATGTVVAGDVTSVSVNCAVDRFAVGGTVAGLVGSGLVLQNDGGDDLPVNANGGYGFATTLRPGDGYAVTVGTQPTNPWQTCTVANASGTMPAAAVENVDVTCSTSSFTVGGAINAFGGTGLVLANGTDTFAVPSGATSFTMPTPVASGAAYAITVSANPTGPSQTCVVTNGSGTMAGGAVTNVSVDCVRTRFDVGGTVTGLTGSGLGLRLTRAEGVVDLAVDAGAARFSFAGADGVRSGLTYAVTVTTQPANPTQTCTATNNTGTVAGTAVSSITVNCTTTPYAIGGTVSNALGGGLTLGLTGSTADGMPDSLLVSSGATSFQFGKAVVSGGSYGVAVTANPTNPWQTCGVTNSSGVVGSSAVSDVAVACTTNTYTVSGGIAGLTGVGLVLRLTNGTTTTDLPVSGTSFAFGTSASVPSGSAWSVSVLTQPTSPWQTCNVTSNPNGTMSNANVTNLGVTCSTDSFPLGGSVTGLTGTGMVVTVNATNIPVPSGATSYAFPSNVPSGTAYTATVSTGPSNPTQDCVVANSPGTIQGAAVSNVNVSCTTRQLTVGGTLSGISAPAGPTLLVTVPGSGTSTVTPSANAGYVFPVAFPSGSSYVVSIFADPLNKRCTVANPSGTFVDTNVGNVDVSCVDTYAIGGTVRGLPLFASVDLASPGRSTQTVNGTGTDRVYTFLPRALSGDTYSVTATTSGPANCSVPVPSGTVGTSASTVDVYCSPNSLWPASCQAWKTLHPTAPSGTYTIDTDGLGSIAPVSVYCDQTTSGGGWTLAMKAGGSSSILGYASAYWTDANLLNVASTDLSDTEAKFEPFLSMAVTNLLIGYKEAGVTNTITTAFTATNLRTAFSGAANQVIAGITRAQWMSLTPNAALALNCNRGGINIQDNVRVRLGFVANNETSCGSSDSYIGIGGAASTICSSIPGSPTLAVGNRGCWDVYNASNQSVAERVVASWGYIYVK
ncbi:MAG: fibrinogen-like YCDxxxxGGGW domain-containing protein [Polyangiaceae bacterium]